MRDYTESYLELSLDYANAGLLMKQLRYLQNTVLHMEGKCDNSPMVSYYLGYFLEPEGRCIQGNRLFP